MKLAGNNTLLYISIALAVTGAGFLVTADWKPSSHNRKVPLVDHPKTDDEFLRRIDFITQIDDLSVQKTEIKRLIPHLARLPIDRIIDIFKRAEWGFGSDWRAELTLEGIVFALFDVPDGQRQFHSVLSLRNIGVIMGPGSQSSHDAQWYHKKYGFRKSLDGF